jgi:hypothetical protein
MAVRTGKCLTRPFLDRLLESQQAAHSISPRGYPKIRTVDIVDDVLEMRERKDNAFHCDLKPCVEKADCAR